MTPPLKIESNGNLKQQRGNNMQDTTPTTELTLSDPLATDTTPPAAAPAAPSTPGMLTVSVPADFFLHANLTDADLQGANLSGADLSTAILSGANLKGANLTGADLRGTSLEGVDLSSATLTGAMFHKADVMTALLAGAKFDGVDITAVLTQLTALGMLLS
jgi:uncharacterized protein YjbI with pentapeptide repeats